MKEALVVGAGWLGLPLALALGEAGWEVTATTRKSAANWPAPIKHLPLELDGDLPDLSAFTLVVLAFPPQANLGAEVYARRTERLCKVLSPRAQLLLISSTGVYPDAPGEYDETAAIKPEHPVVLGEQALLRHFPQALVLRAAGLAGYDRRIGKFFSGRVLPDPQQVVNLVHRDDVVGAALHLIGQRAEGIYNVVAPEHPTKAEVYGRDLEELGMPPFQVLASGAPTNLRVIVTQRLLATGFVYHFADPLKFV
jgi:nucleoside-diphosphate-sugar epimerase